ncbi:MAG TPA: hypothetical protein PKH14_12800 [Syntrophorhabdus sp.]|nr:hypothetical protein [Syntrophorhabdus sp.]
MSEDPPFYRLILKISDEEIIRACLAGKNETDISYFLDQVDHICRIYRDDFNAKNKGFRSNRSGSGVGYRSPVNSNEIKAAINNVCKVLDKGVGLWPPRIFNTLKKDFDDAGNIQLPLKLKYESLLSDAHVLFRSFEQLLTEYEQKEKPKRQNPGGDRYGFTASILFAYKELWGMPTKSNFEPLLQAVNAVLPGENIDRSLKADIKQAFDQVKHHEENRKINIEIAKKNIENIES